MVLLLGVQLLSVRDCRERSPKLYRAFATFTCLACADARAASEGGTSSKSRREPTRNKVNPVEAFAASMERPGPYAEVVQEPVAWWNPFEQPRASRVQSDQPWGDFMDYVFYEGGSGRTPAWDAVVREAPAAAIIASLMGSATAAFFYGQLIVKRGGAERVIPWHQDLPYWKVEGRQIGTVWVALDDMPAEAGVQYIPGSHRWPGEAKQWLDVTPAQAAEAVSFAVRAGDAVCFDARVVHGSPGNPEGPGSSHRRVALRFGGDDAVYWERAGHTPIPIAEVDRAHGLRHGDSLACSAFPRVFNRAPS